MQSIGFSQILNYITLRYQASGDYVPSCVTAFGEIGYSDSPDQGAELVKMLLLRRTRMSDSFI